MSGARRPGDEEPRLEALRRYRLLDTGPEAAFDDLARLAAVVCGTPIAVLSVIDADRQWFKSRIGWPLSESPRDLSFSAQAILQRDLFVVPDASRDPRFADNPFVAGVPGLRFYAGAPLITPEGFGLGALAVLDGVPRTLTPEQAEALMTLGRQAMAQIDLRRQARELRESEARLRLVTDNARVGLVVVNREHEYVYANDAYSEILGLQSPAAAGRRIADVLGRVYDEQVRPRLDRAFAGGRVAYELHTTAPRDGYYSVRYEPTESGGAVELVVVVLTDVTELRRAAIAANRLAAIVESSNDAIIGKDVHGFVTTWNKSAERIFGYTAEEMVGSSILRLIPPDRSDEEQRILDSIRGGTAVQQFDTVRVDKAGRRLEMSITSSPIRDAAGAIVGASKVARDMTDRRILEQQFQQAQKMEAVGRLAGGIAHDFNNLLTAILGNCELALAELRAEDPLWTDLTEIQKAGTTAAALTGQLLAFSRKQIIEPALLDLNDVVTDMRAMIGRIIGEDVEVVLALAAGPVRVMADRGQMEQLLLNLVVNARDAMPRGGRLTIETALPDLDDEYAAHHFGVQPGAYSAIVVTDNGAGMSAEVQSHLFEPFFTTKEIGKGTGLGLATVHGVVARAGGSIGVYSELGSGTSFKIYLPRAEASATLDEGPRPATGSAATGQTILLVEDAEGLRTLTRRLLERLGYRVLVAGDAEEALRSVEADPAIDLLLTDVVMPGASGPELSRRVLERRPGLKVVFMSGYTEEVIVHHGVLLPGIAFLHKPFTGEALARKVREALG